MDVVGSEIGQKMRSAIKAKLTELGCYVDDELPDYVMVMVANKRTRAQMEDDLQLFLGDNTELFVNWLHQVLKKLQEVTVSAPLLLPENPETDKQPSSSKEKSKEKKQKSKHKKSDSKKSKKKDKHKQHKRKEEKKGHKSKKKSKHREMIRPNVPPLLMNMEKVSEPSITDVFAGQILKNHGISLEANKVADDVVDIKPFVQEEKRMHFPIIDPATISSQPSETGDLTTQDESSQSTEQEAANEKSSDASTVPREDQLKEMNEIEAKIQGLKQKLVDQLDSISDDDADFLNIRTEAEELMNDFAEDVLQEISSANPPSTDTPPPLLLKPKSPPVVSPLPTIELSESTVSLMPEVLPQIELQLPKRPLRARLGARNDQEKDKDATKVLDKRPGSQERFTPEREPLEKPQNRVSVRSRLGNLVEVTAQGSVSEESSGKHEHKRITSMVSAPERAVDVTGGVERRGPASVVRVRPRPRASAAAPSLLLRAVADAHKSLLNAPAKVDSNPSMVKRALVRPMRRAVEAQKIVIQVSADCLPSASPTRDNSECEIDFDTESLPDVESDADNRSSKVSKDFGSAESEYVPTSITRKFINADYVPSRTYDCNKPDSEDIVLDTITIHNPTTGKDKGPQFVVTLDGLDPNMFLAKKLKTEGLIVNDDELKINTSRERKKLPKQIENTEKVEPTNQIEKGVDISETKRLSDTNEDCDMPIEEKEATGEERKDTDVLTSANIEKRKSDELEDNKEVPKVKKRKASPIVFDVDKKEKVRERTESASSDGHVTISTATNSHKYDDLPSLSEQEKRLQSCRSFPLCRFGPSCVFQHPPCKFGGSCSRRSCVYSHPALHVPPAAPLAPLAPLAAPAIASHVVPAANYKSISTVALPSMCKYYPKCGNPGCHYFHPKVCRYGKACINKLECNFYHHDVNVNAALKWRSSKV